MNDALVLRSSTHPCDDVGMTTTCPICGGTDVESVTYNARQRDLDVKHSDDTRCTRAPVDERGNYVR
jgi:hypothetical protein